MRGTFSAKKIGNSGWNQLDTLLGIGDFDSNGNNDLLARDMNGALWLYSGPGTGKSHGPRTKIGSGWQTYDQLVAPGDFNGDDKNDIIATDAEGVLWFYSGTGQITNSDEGYLQRQKIGTSGWTMFSDVLGIGDYNSDNKTDLLGIDHNGNAWFYQGTQMQDPGYQPMTPGGTL